MVNGYKSTGNFTNNKITIVKERIIDLFMHSATNRRSIGTFLHNMMSKFDSQTSQEQIR
jgi:hypothetical protein